MSEDFLQHLAQSIQTAAPHVAARPLAEALFPRLQAAVTQNTAAGAQVQGPFLPLSAAQVAALVAGLLPAPAPAPVAPRAPALPLPTRAGPAASPLVPAGVQLGSRGITPQAPPAVAPPANVHISGGGANSGARVEIRDSTSGAVLSPGVAVGGPDPSGAPYTGNLAPGQARIEITDPTGAPVLPPMLVAAAGRTVGADGMPVVPQVAQAGDLVPQITQGGGGMQVSTVAPPVTMAAAPAVAPAAVAAMATIAPAATGGGLANQYRAWREQLDQTTPEQLAGLAWALGEGGDAPPLRVLVALSGKGWLDANTDPPAVTPAGREVYFALKAGAPQ